MAEIFIVTAQECHLYISNFEMANQVMCKGKIYMREHTCVSEEKAGWFMSVWAACPPTLSNKLWSVSMVAEKDAYTGL